MLILILILILPSLSGAHLDEFYWFKPDHWDPPAFQDCTPHLPSSSYAWRQCRDHNEQVGKDWKHTQEHIDKSGIFPEHLTIKYQYAQRWEKKSRRGRGGFGGSYWNLARRMYQWRSDWLENEYAEKPRSKNAKIQVAIDDVIDESIFIQSQAIRYERVSMGDAPGPVERLRVAERIEQRSIESLQASDTYNRASTRWNLIRGQAEAYGHEMIPTYRGRALEGVNRSFAELMLNNARRGALFAHRLTNTMLKIGLVAMPIGAVDITLAYAQHGVIALGDGEIPIEWQSPIPLYDPDTGLGWDYPNPFYSPHKEYDVIFNNPRHAPPPWYVELRFWQIKVYRAFGMVRRMETSGHLQGVIRNIYLDKISHPFVPSHYVNPRKDFPDIFGPDLQHLASVLNTCPPAFCGGATMITPAAKMAAPQVEEISWGTLKEKF